MGHMFSVLLLSILLLQKKVDVALCPFDKMMRFRYLHGAAAKADDTQAFDAADGLARDSDDYV